MSIFLTSFFNRSMALQIEGMFQTFLTSNIKDCQKWLNAIEVNTIDTLWAKYVVEPDQWYYFPKPKGGVFVCKTHSLRWCTIHASSSKVGGSFHCIFQSKEHLSLEISYRKYIIDPHPIVDVIAPSEEEEELLRDLVELMRSFT